MEKITKIGKKGLDLIKAFEGLFLKPYLCPAGIPTIGYGNTFYENGKKIDALPNRMSKKLLAVLTFNTKAGEEVLAKVGISSVDYEGASKNLEAEINHWDFNKVKNDHGTWKYLC